MPLSRTEHTNPGQYMPATPAQGSPQYVLRIPRFRVDNCDLGIARFLAAPLRAGAMRRPSREMYETTVDEMYGKLDLMNERYPLQKKTSNA
jgi:hypothetical protein